MAGSCNKPVGVTSQAVASQDAAVFFRLSQDTMSGPLSHGELLIFDIYFLIYNNARLAAILPATYSTNLLIRNRNVQAARPSRYPSDPHPVPAVMRKKCLPRGAQAESAAAVDFGFAAQAA